MINKQYKPLYISIFAICAILMIIGAFFDRQITNSLYAPKTIWALVLAGMGAIPIYLALPLLSTLLIFADVKYKALSKICGVILLVMSCAE